ncbi:MAG TPA: SpoIIE family protein phosphatase [Stellaceae bacterium]|nr:SpoIIE family protein phosphatase [Stellaceae bacterium]
MSALLALPLDCAVAARALGDAALSGDLYLAQPTTRGIRVAVIDGLGHGPEAARAAESARATLAAAADETPERLIESCHQSLRATRGAALTLAELDRERSEMTWVAVGNVEGMVLRVGADGAREKIYVLARGGIVGHRLPPLRRQTVALKPGDLLILATDGIRAGFDEALDPRAPPQRNADAVLRRYGRKADDALVLVGRWRGPHPAAGPPS